MDEVQKTEAAIQKPTYTYEATKVLEYPDIVTAVRANVPMYVGGTGLFGFVHYLVSPVALLLACGAKRLDVRVENGFEIRSDVVIPVERTLEGSIVPFQTIRSLPGGPGRNRVDATVLTALSQELSVTVDNGAQVQEWRFVQGVLDSHHTVGTTEATDSVPGTTLRFVPDQTLLTVTDLSPSAFESYLRRLSYLHEGVHFSFTMGGERREYHTQQGMLELFQGLAAPYQLMHEPIHLVAHVPAAAPSRGDLDLEVVMAYHSWKENHIWSFINRGRSVEGGTHEQGFTQALKVLKRKLDLPDSFNNAVVAVLAIRYPGATWEGCLKAKIGNPELRTMVSRSVVDGVLKWLDEHPAVEAQIRQLQTFQFPEAWSGRL